MDSFTPWFCLDSSYLDAAVIGGNFVLYFLLGWKLCVLYFLLGWKLWTASDIPCDVIYIILERHCVKMNENVNSSLNETKDANTKEHHITNT